MTAALSMLGLARKAGKLAVGEEATEQAVTAHRAKLILLSADASERTQRHARLLESKRCPTLLLPQGKDELGAAVGVGGCAVVAVLDVQLADAVLMRLADEDEARYGAYSTQMKARADKRRRRKTETKQLGKKTQRRQKAGSAAKE